MKNRLDEKLIKDYFIKVFAIFMNTLVSQKKQALRRSEEIGLLFFDCLSVMFLRNWFWWSRIGFGWKLRLFFCLSKDILGAKLPTIYSKNEYNMTWILYQIFMFYNITIKWKTIPPSTPLPHPLLSYWMNELTNKWIQW